MSNNKSLKKREHKSLYIISEGLKFCEMMIIKIIKIIIKQCVIEIIIVGYC